MTENKNTPSVDAINASDVDPISLAASLADDSEPTGTRFRCVVCGVGEPHVPGGNLCQEFLS